MNRRTFLKSMLASVAALFIPKLLTIEDDSHGGYVCGVDLSSLKSDISVVSTWRPEMWIGDRDFGPVSRFSVPGGQIRYVKINA